MSTATERARALIKNGDQIGPGLALELLDAQVEAKPEGFVYISRDGVPADQAGRVACINLHPKEGSSAQAMRDVSEKPGEHLAEFFVPGCIVGAVFADLVGIANTPVEGSAVSTNADTGNHFTIEAEELLSRAQQLQDHGVTWAAAVKVAREKGVEYGFLPES